MGLLDTHTVGGLVMRKLWNLGRSAVVLGTIGGLGALVAGVQPVQADAGVVRLQARRNVPAPFYKRIVAEYQKLHPDVAIDYQSIGSGGGIKAFTEQTVHFGATDAPLSAKEIKGVGGAAAIIEIPACAGGVVPTYNLPGVHADLKFTGELLADVYMGKITKWNAPAIARLNPGVNLPDISITPAWRTDGSGTTFVWTNYLCTQSDEFKSTVGRGKAVRWPVGQGGKGNEGVTAVVQQTIGGIGYVEQGYADNNHLAYGYIQNENGKFIKASPHTVSMAGSGAVSQMSGAILAANIWSQPGARGLSRGLVHLPAGLQGHAQSARQGGRPSPGRFSLVGDARRAEVCPRTGLCPPGARRAEEGRSRAEDAGLQG